MAASNPTPFAAIIGDGAKFAARQIMQGLLNNSRITEVVAQHMQKDEDPGIEWASMSKADRAVWKTRATSAISAVLKLF